MFQIVSDCRFGVSPVNYPDPDRFHGDSNIATERIVLGKCPLSIVNIFKLHLR